ncbi:uncharacterized protein FIBRA_07556 [Fibroporia radiculosa]|uniref:RBR-type E3 ubiquitin transferase n=1 Tax=Fibroporia radiculosa TaxID=599839 RepID=J4I0W3_9APHY|nr:uncharacterized protein FIBRA_07556 [Fibroporia radiculosa]CCM05342.1 predicted protein [Fibroporia radiculosa]
MGLTFAGSQSTHSQENQAWISSASYAGKAVELNTGLGSQIATGTSIAAELRRVQDEVRGIMEEEARKAKLEEDQAIWLELERVRQETRRALEEQEITRKLRIEQDTRRSESRATRRIQEEHQAACAAEWKALMAESAREEAGKIFQCVVLGSLVTLGAGLDIREVITGFESCTVHIKGLPGNATKGEVCALFIQQGVDAGRFYLSSMKKTPAGKQEAEVVTDIDSGKILSAGLDGTEFRDEVLSFGMIAENKSEGMMSNAARSVTVLTISFRSPSAQYVADFPDMAAAECKVGELTGKIFCGRKVQVEMNTLPPGRILSMFRPNSIKIRNLSPTVTDGDIIQFTGSSSVRRLKEIPYSTAGARSFLLEHMENIKLSSTLENLTFDSDRTDGIVSAEARFASWEDAHRLHESLAGKTFSCIGNSRFWLRLPSSLQYTIIIPSAQYHAQRAQWTSLVASLIDKKTCNLTFHEHDKFVRIRVSGSDKRATGALKVKVENLASGEKVAGWHRSLGFSGTAFVHSVFAESGAYLRADWRRQALKVYGGPAAVEQAREMIKAELERLASKEWSTVLKKGSVGFFLRRGIPELKETFGEDSVRFDIASRRITIIGGDELRHAFDRLIQESFNSILTSQAHSSTNETCPICYDDVSIPFHLGCGHTYCTACLRHFLVSAVDSTNFPLTCMGDEAKCGVPIAIPTIQKFLPLASFNRLLEVVFATHVATHPQDFKYCKTPDCNQIYRSTNPTVVRALQCPSCFSTVCASCHEDAHQGLSCAEYKARSDPAEQERLNDEWIAKQGGCVKRCPECRVPIEKVDGCNHMSCKCGAHICWRCMGIFASDKIYDHMQEAHGGIHGADAIPELHADVAEQAELLRQAERLREEH